MKNTAEFVINNTFPGNIADHIQEVGKSISDIVLENRLGDGKMMFVLKIYNLKISQYGVYGDFLLAYYTQAQELISPKQTGWLVKLGISSNKTESKIELLEVGERRYKKEWENGEIYSRAELFVSVDFNKYPKCANYCSPEIKTNLLKQNGILLSIDFINRLMEPFIQPACQLWRKVMSF